MSTPSTSPAPLTDRPALLAIYGGGDTLAMLPAGSPAERLAQAGLLIEHHRLPHDAVRALAREPAPAGSEHALLLARCDQMFEQYEPALRRAMAVLECTGGDLDLCWMLAAVVAGISEVHLGQPAAGAQRLRTVLKAVRRDHLQLLEHLAAQALAVAAIELADDHLLDSLHDAAADRAGRPASHAGRSLQRTLDEHRLRQLCDPLPELSPPADLAGTYWCFPYDVAQGLRSLVHGQLGPARQVQLQLGRAIELDFYSHRWRCELGFLGLWCDVIRDDTLAIAATAARYERPASGATLAQWHDSITALAADLQCGGARLAQEAPLLLQEAESRQLVRLAARLRLLLAAQGQGSVADWLEQPRGPVLIDALWLGRRVMPEVEAYAISARAARHDLGRERAQRLLHWHVRAREAHAEATSGAAPAGLTQREWDVLQAMADGLSRDQVAARFGVTLATVKSHINRAYSKLQVSDRHQAAAAVRRLKATRR